MRPFVQKIFVYEPNVRADVPSARLHVDLQDVKMEDVDVRASYGCLCSFAAEQVELNTKFSEATRNNSTEEC